ncbi:hypothetical protein GOBAR_AA00698 [Gossypium barbadense]|uniref:6-phosphofructo-2-kinase domain-containing protein n=1 Tax=Gossypium barbadense TaxID=3634 RepID=A0A2P5YWE3_GOSBA|nr:hypothetical protein GOBAR_AA00698 [Gossypium barbadense]
MGSAMYDLTTLSSSLMLINDGKFCGPNFEAGLQDFTTRLANYEKVYEPVDEGSYIKMIDMASGHGGQIQVNTHLTPRPILLTRHGESRYNVRGRIGGDSVLSDTGEIYMKKLANFVEKRLKSERTASIWTITLQRTILTASPIDGFLKEKPTTLDCGPRTICRRHIMTSSNLYECLWEALQQRIRMITCS